MTMKNIMNKKTKILSSVIALSILTAIPFGCKKVDNNMNVDSKALPYGPYVPAALISSMEQQVIWINPEWNYQLQQSLNGDIFSQLMATATPFAGNSSNVTYAFTDGWNGFVTSDFYNGVMNPWIDVKAATKDQNRDLDLYSISLILKVMAGQRTTDVFGPIPYTELGKEDAKWDCQADLYNTFFSELKEAIDKLTEIEKNTPKFDAKWATFDKSNFGGDYRKWVQVANTLRLRLAMRISKVDPAKAKTEAEAAVSHEFGLLEATPFSIVTSFPNPWATLSGAWADIVMSGPSESFLTGYKDPRLNKYFSPAFDGKYHGIRQGVELVAKIADKYSLLTMAKIDPVRLMSPSESFFLRAEGALNGWDMKDNAQKLYEDGITASCKEYGVDATNYIKDAVSKPAPYVDLQNSANNVNSGDPILSTIGIAWDSDVNKQREQIATQKWIALFPDGMEAWSEFRRTGYPKLWPVKVNNSGGTIPNGEFVKRLPYPSTLVTTAKASVYQAALSCLGGPDNGNTKLWWNK